MVTEHIHGQFRDCYPDQTNGLAVGLAENHVEATEVNAADELETFARLRDAREFASAECAAIAAAHHRHWPLAIEDKTVATLADAHCPGLHIEDSASLMKALVRAGVLKSSAANDIRKTWKKHGSTRFPFVGLADGLAQAHRN